jgi:hypothetical protein
MSSFCRERKRPTGRDTSGTAAAVAFLEPPSPAKRHRIEIGTEVVNAAVDDAQRERGRSGEGEESESSELHSGRDAAEAIDRADFKAELINVRADSRTSSAPAPQIGAPSRPAAVARAGNPQFERIAARVSVQARLTAERDIHAFSRRLPTAAKRSTLTSRHSAESDGCSNCLTRAHAAPSPTSAGSLPTRFCLPPIGECSEK